MTDHPSLIEKLRSSEAFRSLRAEQDVASSLSRHGWSATHSPYYVDLKTDKPRELDVTGSAYWHKPRKSGDIVARVNLFVEVKANSDFHILCAGPVAEQSQFGANEYWIGYSDETQNRIESLLTRFRVDHEGIKQFLHNAELVAFPRHTMRTSILRVDPPPVENSFSAFRETNGKTEKDLDNSVLWRAASALRSAIRSAQAGLVDALESDLAVDLEYSRRRKLPLHDEMHSIKSHACRINLYMPVVVLQSRIWSAHSTEPEELKWFRLVQYSTFGGAEDWIDVVNQRHLEEYLEASSRYFERAFRKVRAKRWL